MSSGWPVEILEKLNHATKVHLHRKRTGVIVDGLRLALSKLKRDFAKLYKIRRKIVIYGYISPENTASMKVLARNGFVKYSKRYKYESVPNDLWVKVI
jgi:RimJ/RimL family protein N-acetyltransferase